MQSQNNAQQDSLGIISMIGPSKYTKEQYVNTYLFVLAKLGESIATATQVSEIDTKSDFLLNFITVSKDRQEIKNKKEKMYDELCEDYQKKYGDSPDDKIKTIYKRQCANALIGMINEYFDDTWGWSRNLKIAIAGPRGGNDQRFIPVQTLPDELQKKLIECMNYPKKKNGHEEANTYE